MSLVFDQADGLAVPHHLADQFGQPHGFLGVHAAGRFIEQQQFGVRGQRQREGHALAGFLGDVGRHLMGQMRQADEVERRLGLLAAQPLFLAQAPGVEQHVGQPRRRAQPVADDQVVEHRRAVEQGRGLERARHAEPGDLVRAQAGHVLPLEQDLARTRRVRAGDQVEEGGLAGAIGADDRVDMAGFERHGHVVHRGQPAEFLGEVADLKHSRLRGGWSGRAAARCRGARRHAGHGVRRRRGGPASSGTSRRCHPGRR